MTEQPGGTYTFLFTDIEGSTKHLARLGDAYADVLRTHDGIIRDATEAAGGRPFGSEGDAQHLVFEDAAAAVVAAAQAQRGLAAQAWPDGHEIRVRMGIHTGAVRRLGDDFVGMPLHVTARIAAAGHGGQVLLSATTYELARDRLPPDVGQRDLGEHRLRDLGRPVRIHQLEIDGIDVDHPPLRSLGPDNVRLPTQITSFVGRAEVDAVAVLVREQRLVTLTGPGGTGKTRLALTVAREVADAFPDGVRFVPLDGVVEAGLVPSEIATSLGIAPGAGSALDGIVTALAGSTQLLVIDNLEQVIDAATDLAALVERSPSIHLLVTSRIPLGVYGEHEFPVPALSVPGPTEATTPETALEFEAVRLFVDRAKAARPAFELGPEDVEHVVGIVRRLDGLPLAIELATARLRILPLRTLHERIDRSLSMLSGGGRDRPDRQRTLRDAIAWSHDLLDSPDRRLFARLGVMAGSAPIERIEAICGPADELGKDVFEGIESLVGQSLLRLVDAGGEPRFAMLATIREFAAEQLDASGEAGAVGRRHTEAFLALAEAAEPHLLGPDGRRWNDVLELDHDDLRSAIDRSVETGDAETAMRLVAALWRFWQVRGHLNEARERAQRVLALPGVDTVAPAIRARAEGAAGGIAYWRAEPSAYEHYDLALRYAREADEPALLAAALYDKGFAPAPGVTVEMAAASLGRPYYDEALSIYRELGDRGGEAKVLWALSQAAFSEGDMEEATELGRRALEGSKAAGDPFGTGWAAYTLGLGHASMGDWAAAVGSASESLDVFEASGDAAGMLMVTFALGQAAAQLDLAEAGWRLIGATQTISQRTGTALATSDAVIENVRVRQEPETADESAWFDAGTRLDLAEALELAREVIGRLREALEAGAHG